LSAHERALGSLAGERRRLALGLSDHVAGAELPGLLAMLRQHDADLLIELHIASSAPLLSQYDERRLDAVIVRNEPDQALRDDAEPLFSEPLLWLAAPAWEADGAEGLPLALLAAPCGVRAAAIRVLDAAGIPWREAFVGGGIAAVGAAAAAGLAVAPLARRAAPRGLVDVGAKLGLPALPASRICLHSRLQDGRSVETLRLLANSLRTG
jgi:DNA-binding transcriptional LysR family regulator